MIRDYALCASGLLVPQIGGPSVRPYQPPGVWEAVAMMGSNTRNYVQDKGESLYRRSLYTFWKRAAPPALMETFNAPSRETCTSVSMYAAPTSAAFENASSVFSGASSARPRCASTRGRGRSKYAEPTRVRTGRAVATPAGAGCPRSGAAPRHPSTRPAGA